MSSTALMLQSILWHNCGNLKGIFFIRRPIQILVVKSVFTLKVSNMVSNLSGKQF